MGSVPIKVKQIPGAEAPNLARSLLVRIILANTEPDIIAGVVTQNAGALRAKLRRGFGWQHASGDER
jgi:hypothetical protein